MRAGLDFNKPVVPGLGCADFTARKDRKRTDGIPMRVARGVSDVEDSRLYLLAGFDVPKIVSI